MGQKANPIGLRTGFIFDWKSKWFATSSFRKYLQHDHEIRQLVYKKLEEAAITKIEISRSSREVTVSIYSPRPGVIIGRGGTGVEELKNVIAEKVFSQLGKKIEVKVNIEEIKESLGDATVVACGIVEQLEKRVPFRRVIKQALDRAKESHGVEGIKIQIAGRLNNSDMARTESVKHGNIPLHTLRANVDFACDTARTNVGAVGIKVWIYKGQVFKGERVSDTKDEDKSKSQPRRRRQPQVVRPKK